MLSKKKRLTRAIFKPLLASPSVSHSPHFWLKTAPASTTRLGVSISKKVAKSAVVRNRIRRRVYAALRPLFPKLKPALYLVIAKSGAENLKGEELGEELFRLIRSIRN